MNEQRQGHILLIEEPAGRRAVALEAATYSIGRDPTNAIRIITDSISRQHALLLRVPNPDQNGYHFRIVDGNAAGKKSANGVRVNGERQDSWDLQDGDVIELSTTVKLTYQLVDDMPSAQMIETADFRSIKSKAVDAAGTMLMDDALADSRRDTSPAEPIPSGQQVPTSPEFDDETPTVSHRPRRTPKPPPTLRPLPSPGLTSQSRSTIMLWAGLGGVLLVVIIFILLR